MSLRGQVRAHAYAYTSHNNASGQCRDSTSPFQGELLPQRFSSFQSLKVLVLTVLRPSYLYPYYIALR
ncbi:uncharacterized protein K441DRAFT_660613 [Cenococcum geophilum 1.58]|uniref:uncharacterized protein n=1 Tax=Cenococcum geophilum 1.58 TaxID=794803 RepID=UPI00358FCAEC|nr:hypothetical protein K441DRAFT_660613 [Cenococcum geophilum 1.58]